MKNADAHKPLRPELEEALAPHLGGRSFADAFADFERDGYIVFENVIGQNEIDRVRAALKPYFDRQRTGRNDFEGLASNREYALLAKGIATMTIAACRARVRRFS